MLLHKNVEHGDPPTNFRLSVLNSTAIRLSWNSPLLPYGVLLSYSITYNASGGNISIVKNSSDPRYLVVAGLQEYTLYRFEIVASTRVGSGPYAYKVIRTDISGIICLSRFLHSIVTFDLCSQQNLVHRLSTSLMKWTVVQR